MNSQGLHFYSPDLLLWPPDHLALFADFTDSNGAQHVVVGLDPTVAAAIAGLSFTDGFPYAPITESDLDNALRVANAYLAPGVNPPGAYCNVGTPCADAEDVIDEFFFYETPQIAALPGSFDLVSFSDGAIVGSGTASLVPLFGTPAPSSPIPEPSTWAMMLLGFAGLGYAGFRTSRRRRLLVGKDYRVPNLAWTQGASMGGAFWNRGRVFIARAALAVLAHPAPAFADQASVVGYELSIDVDYPPVDPGNPNDTPTLTNVVIVAANGTGNAAGAFYGIDYWIAPATPTGSIPPIQIPPSDVTQTVAVNDEEQFVLSQLLLSAAPNYIAIFADFTDASNVQHVVVGMDPSVAAAIAGQSFPDTFQTTSIAESDLDNALQTLNTFLPIGANNADPSLSCVDGPCDDALLLIFDFAYAMESVRLLTSYPDLEGLPAVPGSFDLVSYSDGAIVGSGTASLIPLFGAPTSSTPIPEPSTWAMMLLGFAGLGYAGFRTSRRRRLGALA